MDPRMNSRQEYNRNDNGKKQDNSPGVYYHPQADVFVETAGQRHKDGTMSYDHETGKIQADAFVQIGYRLASEEEVKRYRAQLAERAKEIEAKQAAKKS